MICILSLCCINSFAANWYSDKNFNSYNIRCRGYAYTYYHADGYVRVASAGTRCDKIDSDGTATFDVLYLRVTLVAHKAAGGSYMVDTDKEPCRVGIDYINTGSQIYEQSDSIAAISTCHYGYTYSNGGYELVVYADDISLTESQIAQG